MLMPDFVDDFARGDGCRRNDGEKAKASIGVDGGAGLIEAPAVIAREPLRKIQPCVGLEIMLPDALPQLPTGKRPNGLVGLNVDFELRALQQKLAMIFHK